MSVRSNSSNHNSHSTAIRQEIQRFESVHPSIYAIYDLIDLLPDTLIAHQIREHVVNIEDSFVNSQEWTLSRGVPDLRLGIVGSISSGKSALVHRYLTGSYTQEESPEGGRFKKEIQLDGQSYLLLIRDEGGPPELQFTMWVDAVMFVFSLESEASFTAIYSYYAKMAQYRNAHELPMMLVGTQDAISESSPRVIDDARARQLARDLHCSGYYETCATYGLAVQQVFTDACQKMVANRPLGGSVAAVLSTSRPTTPIRHHTLVHSSPSPLHHKMHTLSVSNISTSLQQQQQQQSLRQDVSAYNLSSSANPPVENNNLNNSSVKLGTSPMTASTPAVIAEMHTPSSTPTTSRKSRRRSNLFTSSRKSEKSENENRKRENGELGSGRAIPLKQGQLYKRSTKSLNKEWKKKYVTLGEQGTLTYYPNLQDYMDDVHGKHIPLQCVTVKVPGQRPRGTHPTTNHSDAVGEDGYLCFTNGSSNMRLDSTSVKKRHRRIRSSGVRAQDNEESDGFEFFIVSLDSKQWHFQAGSADERDDWVCAIEQQILASLQAGDAMTMTSPAAMSSLMTSCGGLTLRRVPGNGACVDCGLPDAADWASLNLGVVMCIECSGIHRNLGSHVSKVRSLQLDEWPPWHLATMVELGNELANSIWEYNTRGAGIRPSSTSSRDEKERWIRRKYELKQFLQPILQQTPPSNQLIEAVCRSDLVTIYRILLHCTSDDVNCPVNEHDTRTPLHLACSLGNAPIAQLLIWHGADVRSKDQDGRSCLWFARTSKTAQDSTVVDLLLAAGCPDN